MVDFRPFRGVRYASGAGALSDLICPPYDVISHDAEQRLRAKNPHNMVRLELAEADGVRDPAEYSAAASSYAAWLANGTLARDSEAAYYLLRQRFPAAQGGMAERYAVLGALRVEELGVSVLPHENTGAAAKSDRYALMEATQANFSPLFMLFRDDGAVTRVRNRVIARPPDAEATVDGEEFGLWRVDQEDDRTAIILALAPKQVFIADGHHRYETALGYSKERTDQSAQFVMTALVPFDDPGLTILPYDRVVHGLDSAELARVRERVRALFVAQPVGLPGVDPIPLEKLVEQEGARGVTFGMVEEGNDGPFLLTLLDPTVLDEYLGVAMPASVREVEAWVLQEAVLRPALGDSFVDHVTAVHEGAIALEMVDSGEAQLAFFLKGLPADLFERVVSAGVRLPRKSTYFWPKLPSGMVINPLSGDM